MNNINLGSVQGDQYIKVVDFSKAVLWKSRELSIQPGIFWKLQEKGVSKLRFIDRGKGEEWIFDVNKVLNRASLRKEGQEPQYYFPIELARKKKIGVKNA